VGGEYYYIYITVKMTQMS